MSNINSGILSNLDPRVLSLLKKKTHIILGESMQQNEVSPYWESRYYGKPWFPSDYELPPENQEFLLQLVIEDFPPIAEILERDHGLLSIFINPEDNTQYSVFVFEPNQPGSLIEMPGFHKKYKPIRMVRSVISDEYPSLDEDDITDINPNLTQNDWDKFVDAIDEIPDSRLYHLSIETSSMRMINDKSVILEHKDIVPKCFAYDKIGGYPRWEENKMPVDIYNEPMRLVLQIGYDEILSMDKIEKSSPVWGRVFLFYSSETGELKLVNSEE